MKKAEIIEKISECLISADKNGARRIIADKYPFVVLKRDSRTYTVRQKMEQFSRDGFIDRYSGERLVNPGMLKVISVYFPEEFPYHSHWKTTETHQAYWELVPTIDHIIPIANGGKDAPENWATTSMLNNSIKSNWTLEQLRWSLYPQGDMKDWDGLTHSFVEIVGRDNTLLEDAYIKQWYDVSKGDCEMKLPSFLRDDYVPSQENIELAHAFERYIKKFGSSNLNTEDKIMTMREWIDAYNGCVEKGIELDEYLKDDDDTDPGDVFLG